MYITPKAIFIGKIDYEETLIELWEQLPSHSLWSQIKTSCFLMTGLVNLRFTQLGQHAQAVSGTVLAQSENKAYKLGFPGLIESPNQVDGHIFSVINHTFLIDFGLSNIRKYAFPKFPKAIAHEFPGKFPFTLKFEQGQTTWDTALANPNCQRIYEEHLPLTKKVLEELGFKA
jgi:hypothetical protein